MWKAVFIAILSLALAGTGSGTHGAAAFLDCPASVNVSGVLVDPFLLIGKLTNLTQIKDGVVTKERYDFDVNLCAPQRHCEGDMQRAGSYYISQLNTAANPRAITACSNGLFDTVLASIRPSGSALKVSYLDASGLRTAKVVVTCGGDSALSSLNGTFHTTLNADTAATKFTFFLQSSLVCGPPGAPIIIPDDDDDVDDDNGDDYDSGSSGDSNASTDSSDPPATNGRGGGPAAPSAAAVTFWSSPWFIVFLLAAAVLVAAGVGLRFTGQNIRGMLRGFFVFSVAAAAAGGAHATVHDESAPTEDSSVVVPGGASSAIPVVRRAYTRLDSVDDRDNGGGVANSDNNSDDGGNDFASVGHRAPPSLRTGESTAVVVAMPTSSEGTAADMRDAFDDAEEMQPIVATAVDSDPASST